MLQGGIQGCGKGFCASSNFPDLDCNFNNFVLIDDVGP